ncbi:major facilitator superfamily domain-containing protein [Geopyxis carbonaria]|nr:major facilitator superfamily domain-containing protein [Geopyxis carbonaria]
MDQAIAKELGLEQGSDVSRVDEPQRWNSPSINKVRLPTMFLSYMMMGICNSGIGIQYDYQITYTIVALLFFFQVFGYFLAALTINALYPRIGLRGIGILSGCAYVSAFLVLALHSPFPVLVVGMSITGFGGGLGDAAYNCYVGKMENASGLLGCMHAFYGLGAVVTPLAATAMIEKGFQWNMFYYIALSMQVLISLLVVLSFRHETAAKYRDRMNIRAEDKSNGTAQAFSYGSTWAIGFFMMAYMFGEVSIGGWIVTFIRDYRDASALGSSYVVSGFWLGITAGGFTLSWISTHKPAMVTFFILAIACEVVLWRINSFLVSAISVAFFGYFTGPQYPTALLMMQKLVPPKSQGPAVALAAAFGSAGGCVGPFIIGAMAETKFGIQVVHPWVIGLLILQILIWVMLPTKSNEVAQGEDSASQ